MKLTNNLLASLRFLDIKLIDVEDFLELVIRFGFNLFIVLLLARFIYYAKARRKDYLITYILISSTIFLLCYLLESVKIELGFALGLFAIFGIIRYRTSQMEIKEMTYLFIVIGVSVINALSNKKISYAELLFTNMALVAVTWSLEYVFLIKHEIRKVVIYERIDLIKPEFRTELMADLELRTGLKIHRIEIGKIDFLRDTARIYIFYFEKDNMLSFPFEERDSGGDD